MATRLYLRALVSDYGTGNNDANLRATASAWDNRALSLTAGTATSLSASVLCVVGAAAMEFLAGANALVWYSAPLDADVTISGSIVWNLWGFETTMSTNACMNGRLEVIDGATGAITLIDQTARVTEMSINPTKAVNNFAETPAAGVLVKRGDRLRVRPFVAPTGTFAAEGASFFFDGTVAQQADSWLELTENLTFASEPAGSTVYPTDTASGVAVAALLSAFTGADEDPLSEGGNWAKLSSSNTRALRRVGNQLAPESFNSSLMFAYWTPANFGPDVEAYATVAAIGNNEDFYVCARIQGEGGANTWDGYQVYVPTGLSYLKIQRVADSTATDLGTSFSFTPANGMKIGIACRGSTIEAWLQLPGGGWQMVKSATDATYASAGKVGVGIVGYGGPASRMDDFYAGSTTTSFSVLREAWTSRGAGVQNDVVNSVAGFAAPIQWTDTAGGTAVEWYTKPLTAFTLGGAVRVNARGLRNSTGFAAPRCEIAVVAGDGTGATAWASGTAANTSGYYGTSEAAISFLVSGDDVAVTDGKRLRIRFLVDDYGPAMGAGTVTLFYAGGAGASGDTYLTLSQTLTEFSVSTDKTYAAVLKGGGVVAFTASSARARTQTLTGGGVALVTAPKKAAVRVQAMTGGGVAAITYSRVEAHSGTAVLTGGGVLAITGPQKKASRVQAMTGGGVATLAPTKKATRVQPMTGGGIVAIVYTTSMPVNKTYAATLTGGGVAVYTGRKAAAFVPAAGYASTILGTSGLVAYWRLGETSGITAVAEFGGVDATHVNSPTLGVAGATADANKAVTYDGSTQYSRTITLRGLIGVDRPEPMAGTIQDVGDVVTMEAWVLRTGSPGGWRGIVSKGTGAYYMRMDGGTGQIALVKSRVAALGVTTTGVPVGGWHHVVCTKNGAAIKQYIDGVDVTGTMANQTFVDNDEAITIGADTYPTGAAEFWQGGIDEVAIYNRVLTPAEVSAHYSAATGAGAAFATGGGVITRTAVKTAVRTQTMTGGGVAVLLRVAARGPGAITATGGGVATLARTSARPRTFTATGGGVIRYTYSSGTSRSANITATGGGVITRTAVKKATRTQTMTGGGVIAYTATVAVTAAGRARSYVVVI